MTKIEDSIEKLLDEKVTGPLFNRERRKGNDDIVASPCNAKYIPLALRTTYRNLGEETQGNTIDEASEEREEHEAENFDMKLPQINRIMLKPGRVNRWLAIPVESKFQWIVSVMGTAARDSGIMSETMAAQLLQTSSSQRNARESLVVVITHASAVEQMVKKIILENE
ncbi:hypothetical protein MHU86_8069 [Fragilaria crotonensis]|nr:hypothetical protein MHU86_8069 [Fragilaria crotonensis]